MFSKAASLWYKFCTMYAVSTSYIVSNVYGQGLVKRFRLKCLLVFTCVCNLFLDLFFYIIGIIFITLYQHEVWFVVIWYSFLVSIYGEYDYFEGLLADCFALRFIKCSDWDSCLGTLSLYRVGNVIMGIAKFRVAA